MPQRHSSKSLKGQHQNSTALIIEGLREAWNVNSVWLRTGQGEMLLGSDYKGVASTSRPNGTPGMGSDLEKALMHLNVTVGLYYYLNNTWNFVIL